MPPDLRAGSATRETGGSGTRQPLEITRNEWPMNQPSSISLFRETAATVMTHLEPSAISRESGFMDWKEIPKKASGQGTSAGSLSES